MVLFFLSLTASRALLSCSLLADTASSWLYLMLLSVPLETPLLSLQARRITGQSVTYTSNLLLRLKLCLDD